MKENPAFKPGWNKKRKNSAFTWRQIQILVGKAKTKEEWIAAFNILQPKDQWDILYKYHTPPKQVDINQGVRVTLEIKGLDDAKVIEGQVIEHQALEMHQDDAE